MVRFALVGCGLIALMVVDLASADSLRGKAAAPKWDPLLDGEWVEATVDIPKCCPAGLTGLRRFNMCTQFYHCVDGTVVNGTGDGGTCVDGCVKTCPDGTLFHEDIQVCTHDDNRDHPFECQGEHECGPSTETATTATATTVTTATTTTQTTSTVTTATVTMTTDTTTTATTPTVTVTTTTVTTTTVTTVTTDTTTTTVTTDTATTETATTDTTTTVTTETTTTVTTATTITVTATTETTTTTVSTETTTTQTATTDTTTTETTTTPPPTNAPTRAPTAPPTAPPTAAPVYVVVANTNIVGPQEDPTCTTEPTDCGPGCGPGCCGVCSGVDGCTQVCNARADCAGFVTFTCCGGSTGAIIKVRGGPIARCTVSRNDFFWHMRTPVSAAVSAAAQAAAVNPVQLNGSIMQDP